MWAAISETFAQWEYFAPPSSPLRDFPLAPLVPLVLFTDQHKKYSQRPGGALGGRSWGCEMPKMCLNLTQAPRGVSRGARSLRSGYGRHHTPHPSCGGYVCCYMAVLAGPCGICNAPRGRVSPGDAPWALGTAQSVLVRSDVPLGPLSPFDWLVFSLRLGLHSSKARTARNELKADAQSALQGALLLCVVCVLFLVA